jgi:hypothetical protein
VQACALVFPVFLAPTEKLLFASTEKVLFAPTE